MIEAGHGARRAAPLRVGLALVVAAAAPRLAPALAGYQPSNDAAEHLLIARSLARGDGFTLPIRVRDVDGGPAVHDAYGERAPLFPWLLSLPVRAGVGAEGWPDPRLQLVGVALAALCAPLAASVAWTLARRRGLGAWSAAWAAVGAGLVVAWAPSLVRASVHLWAEPLGLLLVLLAVRLELAVAAPAGLVRDVGAQPAAPAGLARERRGDGVALAFALGVVGALARFARPEAWVVVVLIVAAAVGRARRGEQRWREVAALVAGAALVNAAGVAITGVVAPQLFLLEVRRFEEAMGAGATPPRPGVGEVLRAVASNLAGQLWFLLQPKNAWFALPLAALALVRGAKRATAERWLVAWALAFVAATAGVWSTSDPYRFTIAPLALLAPVALVEALAWARRLWPGRRWPLAVVMATLVLVMGHAAGREMRGRGPAPPPRVTAQEGVVVTDDPWSHALITGGPAVLAAQEPAGGRR